ncbi:hypothetical protein QUA82_35765, partial [Microcoleus sp. F8-D3]
VLARKNRSMVERECHVPIPKKAATHFEKKTLRSSQAHKEIPQKKRIESWEKIRDIEPENLIFFG